ncbi:uncharacterized protein AAGF69_008718 [Amazona ochrocephala]
MLGEFNATHLLHSFVCWSRADKPPVVQGKICVIQPDLTRSLDSKLKIFCNFIILSFASSVQQRVIFIHAYLYMHRDICSTWLSTLAAVQFPLTSMNSSMKPKCSPLFAPGPACGS